MNKTNEDVIDKSSNENMRKKNVIMKSSDKLLNVIFKTLNFLEILMD